MIGGSTGSRFSISMRQLHRHSTTCIRVANAVPTSSMQSSTDTLNLDTCNASALMQNGRQIMHKSGDLSRLI